MVGINLSWKTVSALRIINNKLSMETLAFLLQMYHFYICMLFPLYKTSYHFPSLLSRAVLQQSDQYFQENEAELCVTSITDPESVFRDKGHDVFKHILLFSAMCSMFAGACHCVWGDGRRKVNDERKATSHPCVCGLWQQPTES